MEPYLLLLLVVTQAGVPRAVARVAYVTAGFVGLQVAIGLAMASLGLTPALQVAHLSTSSLVLGSQTVLFLLARWLR